MIIHFLEQARKELFEAAGYYESKEPHLGKRFRREISRVCAKISENPLLWRDRGGYRRVNCPVFPYYVAYFIREDQVIIAAIAHGYQKPGYWKERLKKYPS